MAKVWVGCCGWPEARAKYYQHFAVVELQDTFYQPPSPELARRWRQEAPPGFAFALKAWQIITHPASSPTYRRLKTPLAPDKQQEVGFFRPTPAVWQAWQHTLAVAEALAAVAIVFQCPASFRPTAENQANLEAFFRQVEWDGRLIAWEPRGEWSNDQVAELCRRLDLVHCVDPFAAEPAWGDVSYFRLHGRGGYRYRYSDEELAWLLKLCQRRLEAGQPVYCLFNNVYMRDDALRFQELVRQALG